MPSAQPPPPERRPALSVHDNPRMDQFTLGLEPLPKKTSKEVFLDELNQAVPWATLVALIAPFARGAHQALGGRPPFPIDTILRIHCLQQRWNLSDPAMEKELH